MKPTIETTMKPTQIFCNGKSRFVLTNLEIFHFYAYHSWAKEIVDISEVEKAVHDLAQKNEKIKPIIDFPSLYWLYDKYIESTYKPGVRERLIADNRGYMDFEDMEKIEYFLKNGLQFSREYMREKYPHIEVSSPFKRTKYGEITVFAGPKCDLYLCYDEIQKLPHDMPFEWEYLLLRNLRCACKCKDFEFKKCDDRDFVRCRMNGPNSFPPCGKKEGCEVRKTCDDCALSFTGKNRSVYQR